MVWCGSTMRAGRRSGVGGEGAAGIDAGLAPAPSEKKRALSCGFRCAVVSGRSGFAGRGAAARRLHFHCLGDERLAFVDEAEAGAVLRLEGGTSAAVSP
jgi:hypothetical protein